jgi:hypothetical protein
MLHISAPVCPARASMRYSSWVARLTGMSTVFFDVIAGEP